MKLKLYLPREKWPKKDMFSSTYELRLRRSETEAASTNAEMNK